MTSTATPFISLPFPARQHPELARIECYPDAPLPEAELAAGWFAWLFFADDHHEEGRDGSIQKWTDVTEAVRRLLEQGLPAGRSPTRH
ncbi:MAG: hypothetical protein WCC65_13730 [Pseudonocardiaceae bacterium]